MILNKGLVVIFTGNGKGKTSAALGVAFRAVGHRMYVSVVQFVKSAAPTGESRAAERLAPELEFVSHGKGFVNCFGDTTPLEEHRRTAEQALDMALQRVRSGSWDIVVLDEVLTAVSLGLLPTERVLELLAARPQKLHVVLTGRDAPDALIAVADMVTEMRDIKHPYETGLQAQKGIDY